MFGVVVAGIRVLLLLWLVMSRGALRLRSSPRQQDVRDTPSLPRPQSLSPSLYSIRPD